MEKEGMGVKGDVLGGWRDLGVVVNCDGWMDNMVVLVGNFLGEVL